MEEEVLRYFIKSFVSELVKEGKSIFQNLYEEGKQFLEIGLSNYLEKQKNKYSHIKTLLRGNSPVYLYEVYYPLRLIHEDKSQSTDTIKQVFNKSNYITILGDAGSGKSTLIKHLFLNSIKTIYAIPLLIELRYLNDYNEDISKYIIDLIFENKIADNINILERLLKKGKFVFFFDGYDELNSEVKNNVTDRLNTFINLYQDNKYILTSRPYSNIENFPLFYNYKIQELEKKEILEFIDKQLFMEQEIAIKIKNSVNENDNNFIRSFLKNPLLLSLYILTYQSNSSIPNKKYIFYRRVINALFAEHDSKTKLGFVREKSCGLAQENFEEILKRFCFISFFENRYEFDYDYLVSTLLEVKSKLRNIEFDSIKFITDMKLAIALWLEDNGYISFAHRSLQEYFAASFIKRLTDKQKEIVYKKIKNKITEGSFSEIENLLSLCEEMDTLNFKKYYLLPLLIELKEQLNDRNEYTLVKSFVELHVDKLLISENPRRFKPREIVVNREVWKYFYFSIHHFRDLHLAIKMLLGNKKQSSILLKYARETKSELPNGFPKHGTKIYELDIRSNHERDLNKIFCTKEISSNAYSLVKFLENKINDTEEYINQTTESDKEIIDMI